MTTETETNPADAAAAFVAAAFPAETEVSPPADDLPTEGEDTSPGTSTESGVDTDQPPVVGEEGADDLDEIEIDGKSYKVPKKLVQERLMHADYTRKTQAVAERAKELEAREAQLTEQSKAEETFREERTQLWAMDRQLAAFEKLDWEKLEEDEPEEAAKLFRQHQRLKDARANLASTVDSKQKERELAVQREAQEADAKAIQDLHAALQRDIPGWSPKVAQEIASFGVETLGFTPDELKGVRDPRLIKLLHQAHQGHAALQREAASKKLSQTEKVQPVDAPGGSSPGARKTTDASGDDLSMEEWARRERERTGRRR